MARKAPNVRVEINSEALADVLGADDVKMTDMVKGIWDYAKDELGYQKGDPGIETDDLLKQALNTNKKIVEAKEIPTLLKKLKEAGEIEYYTP